MKRYLPAIAALCIVVAYILATGAQLPDTVASHFDASGAANGFMSRSGYLTFLVALVTLLPGGMMLMRLVTKRLPARWLNVPHRDYWLAPERHAASIEYIGGYLARLGWAMLALFAFLHWQILEANRVQPPHLSNAWFLPPLIVFVAYIAYGVWSFYRRFPRPPR